MNFKNEALNGDFAITATSDVVILTPDGYHGKLTEIRHLETVVGLIARESNLVDFNTGAPVGSKTYSVKKVITEPGFTVIIPALVGRTVLSPIWLDNQVFTEFGFDQATGTIDLSANNGFAANSRLCVWYNY